MPKQAESGLSRWPARIGALLLWGQGLCGAPVLAEEGWLEPWKPAPDTRVKLSFYERLRGEGTHWFGNLLIGGQTIPRTSSYGLMTNRTQLGLDVEHADWLESQFQLQSVVVAGVPSNAVGVGYGYYNASPHSTQASVSVRQGWLKLKQNGFFLTGGRQLYADGAEGNAQERHLKYLQDYRLSQRLIGQLDYAAPGRSFDGVNVGYGNEAVEVSGFYFVPTFGGLNIQGMNAIDGIQLAGLSLSLKEQAGLGNTLGHLGFYHYRDTRSGVQVVDNGPTGTPGAQIDLQTFAGHLAHVHDLMGGKLDFTVFGFGQIGQWQGLDQRSGAYGIEMGYEWSQLWATPWLRAGINSGSGDHNPRDTTHGTFFQMIPSTPIQSPFPFYNLMNNQDVFVQLLARPLPNVGLRLDFHWLNLNAGQDLWYSGSGAGGNDEFGYFGSPGHGETSLANLVHIGGVIFLSPQLKINAFYGHAFGQQVIRGNYSGSTGDFGLMEAVYAF